MLECHYHACSGVLADEGIPQHLCQLAGSEGSVWFVPPQRPDALLKEHSRHCLARWFPNILASDPKVQLYICPGPKLVKTADL